MTTFYLDFELYDPHDIGHDKPFVIYAVRDGENVNDAIRGLTQAYEEDESWKVLVHDAYPKDRDPYDV